MGGDTVDLLKPFKKVVNRVKNKANYIKIQAEQQKKLDDWKKKLEFAISEHDKFRQDAATWDSMYHGTKAVGSDQGRLNMSDRYDKDVQSTTNARQVVNITYQLIESQIDPSVPLPAIDPIEADDDSERKSMVEGMLTYMSTGSQLKRIVSENERITKKNSLSIMKVSYNPDFASHTFRGRIETTNPHPVNVIPQPGVYRVRDMDYLFHIENRTVDYVCRRYGEEFRAQLENENPEYSYLDIFGAQSSGTGTDTGKISVVEAWYKDKDGDVGVLTWANEVLLRDIPKFFYKRDEQGNIKDTEEVEIDATDEQGNVIDIKTVTVKCRVPKQFPFVIQYNIPKEKSYYGKSDPDVIYDQQEGIKKMLSIEEEKQVKGTTKIFTRKGSGLAAKLTTAVSQIIETDDPQSDLKVVDLKTPDNALKDLYGIYLQAAKDALGVTEASQGRADSASLSGRALELLANNSAGRLSTKLFEKQIAFTELYQLYYDFLIAFYDEKRPYRIDGKDNKPVFGYFDKGKLIKQDAVEEWYYPEFDIYITTDSGLPKDKRFIMDSATNALAKNAIDPVEYWMIMESIDFPNASAILEMEQEKKKLQTPPTPTQPPIETPNNQGDIIQQVLSQMSPEEQQAFMSMPQEEQMAMLQQAMGG